MSQITYSSEGDPPTIPDVLVSTIIEPAAEFITTGPLNEQWVITFISINASLGGTGGTNAVLYLNDNAFFSTQYSVSSGPAVNPTQALISPIWIPMKPGDVLRFNTYPILAPTGLVYLLCTGSRTGLFEG